MDAPETARRARARRALLATALASLAAACTLTSSQSAKAHLWWAGFGPVLPHDTFPADCRTCHAGEDWQTLRDDFAFDHEAETGVALVGAHEQASCLRCHNDRGPVATFRAQGCSGCHEDVHQGELGTDCARCHDESSWRPNAMYARHHHTRFPLTGVHSATACHRCHPGAEVGNFLPADTECVTCHASDLRAALNPNHVGLGWVDRCDRCHIPTTWQQAEID